MLDTLSNVKSRLGITGTSHDTFLTQQIQLVSDVIENYCGRKFLTARYIQTFYREDHCPSKKMELFHFPVQSIDDFKVDDVDADDTEYRLHKETGTVSGVRGRSFFWAEETAVKYTAGYDTCPTPVLAVLDDIINERYNKRVAGVALDFGDDVQRISIPGAISIDFDYSLSNNERKSAYGVILGSNVNVLDHWRSERAVLGKDKLEYVETV